MRKVIKLVVIAVIFTVASCSESKVLTPAGYIAFMENAEKAYRRSVSYSNVEYIIQLAPPEYLVSKQLSNKSLDSAELRKRLADLTGHMFFLINIAKDRKQDLAGQGPDPQEAERSVMYYQQQAARDIRLLTGNRELMPVAYNYENNYDLVPYNTIVVGFDLGTNPDSNLQLVFNDQYNRNPLIKAQYTRDELRNIPGVQLQ